MSFSEVEKKPIEKIYNKINTLFPVEYEKNQLPSYLETFFEVLKKKIGSRDTARIYGRYDKETYKILTEKYSMIPLECDDPKAKCEELVSDLFSGVPRWRSPELQYNAGASVNTAATATYSLALDENIYNINDGLAGNALVAERAVSNILAGLAGVTNANGLFTFGGTATNLYAMKIGTRKAAPDSGKRGIPKNMKAIVTRDAHFAHFCSADWLGIGTENVVSIEANPDRTSNLEDAEMKMRQILNSKDLLSTVIINGGTTYSHTIDHIKSFVALRDRLAVEYSLPYKPHLHVDAVIGWAWLMFSGYDFDKNELGINPDTLSKIKKQYEKISEVKYADSWGVDFHKGVGGCPIDCSVVMVNNINDLNLLSKKESSISMHQLAKEFSFNSPSDYTLETSRAGGAALAALTSLHTLGIRGYQRNLANLVEMSILTRNLFGSYEDVMVCNEESLGYVTMFRLYPPELKSDTRRSVEFTDDSEDVRKFVEQVNKYTKDFFSWDLKDRMSKGRGVEYSFSSGYLELSNEIKISAAKLYPVSPHFNQFYAEKAVKTIMNQKKLFDEKV